MKKFIALILVGLMCFQQAYAGDSILRPGHPDKYDVKQGDTLWDIATMFLTDAWLWPEIWQVNPGIENPHLIYPGDEIRLTYVQGQPQLSVARGEASRTVKLSPEQSLVSGDRNIKMSPKIRRTELASAIPAIPLDAIASLLTTGRIVEQHTLDDAPHILAVKADRLLFGPGNGLYARGNWPIEEPSVFGIFRKGEVYIDPETGEVLGYEAREIGTASVDSREGELYSMTLTSVKEDVRIGDRLLPTEERRVESTFFPTAPLGEIDDVIMTVLGGVTQVGRNDVVAINRGLESDANVGTILAIHKKGKIVRDKVNNDSIQLPSERAGILMVFRSFDKMSDSLVLEIERALRVGDTLHNP